MNLERLRQTHQNSFTEGVSDCFWKEGESRGMGAKPPNKLQNSPTSESPTNFPSSAAFQELAAGISFPWKSKKKKKKEIKKIPTYCSHLTFSTMLILFDILNNLQSFSSFLYARVAPTEEENFWCSVKNEYIIVVQWRPGKRHLWTCIPIEIIFQTILNQAYINNNSWYLLRK